MLAVAYCSFRLPQSTRPLGTSCVLFTSYLFAHTSSHNKPGGKSGLPLNLGFAPGFLSLIPAPSY